MCAEPWTAEDIPDQTGRTAIVTGANSGLGFETARHLALRGAHVVLAVRNEAKGREAADRIGEERQGASLEIRRLDLADLDSVNDFAARFRADDAEVDVLVNNAGVMAPPRTLSPQGHEMQFASNHLGHFALTGLLLDRIGNGRDPRVVTVSSLAHYGGRIHFDDLTGERDYSGMGFYRQSKFANLLFGLELDRRLRASRSPVRSLVSHPGLAATSLVENGFTTLTRPIGRLVLRLFTQSSESGALTSLYAATDPRAESGQYIGPDGRREWKGPPRVVRPDAPAEDRETAARLWALSEELTGVRYEFAAVQTDVGRGPDDPDQTD
ncbi:oxidoreductase [Glycomyces sp. L485]|uniref:oxidoreductase n=1 Tax=Glycomyces sp. L485 TaxID=2909235 RepID=UPI001F4B01C3|nr:oxidoreductase [Glycomyces sp. L485]MCH7232704.1 oxidoreductase [Glycomyces sp. L485]